jgi:hypothetical protein
MVFSDCLLIRTWERKSSITFGPSRTMASSITLWLVSASPPRKWAKPLTLSLVVITPLRSLEELVDSRHSETSQTGLEHGHLKDKVCSTVHSQCRNQEKTQHTQLLSTLEVRNYLFHPMYSTRYKLNGHRQFQTSIVPQMPLSVKFQRAVIQLQQRSNQSASK